MKPIYFLSCLWACALVLTPRGNAAPADTSTVQLVLELSDGSRIIGTPSLDKLKITTKYADLEIQLSLMRTLEFKGADRVAHVSLQNGDLMSGQLSVTEIAMKTSFGQVTIPLAQVRRIQVRRPGTAGALPEGLVLHYTFDANEGEKITDTSGSGYDGIVHDATYASEGKIGGAMSFNGDRQAVIAKSPANLKLQDFTVMAWIKRGSADKVSANAENAQLFGYGVGGYGMGLHVDGKIGLWQINGNPIFSSCQVTDNTFHHVAVTKKGSKVVFYLDGVAYPAAGDFDANFVFDSDAVAVGATPDNLITSFIGVIDEVAVFNRALTADEVKGVYDSQK